MRPKTQITVTDTGRSHQAQNENECEQWIISHTNLESLCRQSKPSPYPASFFIPNLLHFMFPWMERNWQPGTDSSFRVAALSLVLWAPSCHLAWQKRDLNCDPCGSVLFRSDHILHKGQHPIWHRGHRVRLRLKTSSAWLNRPWLSKPD